MAWTGELMPAMPSIAIPPPLLPTGIVSLPCFAGLQPPAGKCAPLPKSFCTPNASQPTPPSREIMPAMRPLPTSTTRCRATPSTTTSSASATIPTSTGPWVNSTGPCHCSKSDTLEKTSCSWKRVIPINMPWEVTTTTPPPTLSQMPDNRLSPAISLPCSTLTSA